MRSEPGRPPRPAPSRKLWTRSWTGYEDAQLDALKIALLFASFIALAAFWRPAPADPQVQPSWNRAPTRLRSRPKRPPDRRLPAAILRRRGQRGLDRVEAGSDVLERGLRSPRRAHRERRLRRMPCLSRIWSMSTAVTAAVMTVRNAIPISITTVAIRRPAVPSGTTSP